MKWSDRHLTALSNSARSSGAGERVTTKQKSQDHSVFLDRNNFAFDFVQGLVTR